MFDTGKYLDDLQKDGKLVFERSKPLSSISTIGVGGEADLFVLPKSSNVLSEIFGKFTENKVIWRVVGNSSNIIYPDEGLSGVTICTKKLKKICISEHKGKAKITAKCGAMLPSLCNLAFENSVSGFEGLCSIPGTVGGAVMSNAGAYGCEISDCISALKVLTREGCVIHREADSSCFSYRECRAVFPGETVLSAEFTAPFDDKNKIAERMSLCRKKRAESQPICKKSVGSFFKRPCLTENSSYFGYSAGKLIDMCGLKGLCVGDAIVSEKHANFILNTGLAKAYDIISLAEQIKKTVFENTGVMLEYEPRFF